MERQRARATRMAQVVALGSQLSGPERELVRVVAALRLATHAQLASLVATAGADASADSAARSARRVLTRLTDRGLLSRLRRRIGGVRAGSAGYVYYLGPVGQRLMTYWEGRGASRGRPRPDPGARFIHHRLAVSGLYVQAEMLRRAGRLELDDFQPEPDCWRPYVDGQGRTSTLKPDAFVSARQGVNLRGFFLEVDRGTESRPVIACKLRTYLRYFDANRHDEPRVNVVLLTNTPAREAALAEVCVQVPPEARARFTVSSLGDGLERVLVRSTAVTNERAGRTFSA